MDKFDKKIYKQTKRELKKDLKEEIKLLNSAKRAIGNLVNGRTPNVPEYPGNEEEVLRKMLKKHAKKIRMINDYMSENETRYIEFIVLGEDL